MCSNKYGRDGIFSEKHDESDLLAARHQALEEGITVNPEVWQQLKTFAAQTLVEASALSRSGAGPAE